MVYDEADITVVGLVKLPQPATLQAARRAQAAMPPLRGRAATTGWYLRPAPRAPRVPAPPRAGRGFAASWGFKKK